MYYSINNLHYVNYIHTADTVANGYTLAFLDFIFFISILLTMLVIISKNPIVSVLYLIGLFFNIACYLILLGISFIGLSYLLVYVGAVSILFLFILMLINVRVSELVTESTNSIPLILTIPVLFSYSLQKTLNIISLITHHNNIYDSNTIFNNLYNLLCVSFKYNYMYIKTNNTLYVTSNM
jgi:NADH-ubiquinone oxidoreductase chain 6